MYHTTLFKVPHNPLQSTLPASSMYHTTLFKVPHHPLQSTTPPLQSTTPPLQSTTHLFKVPYTSSKYHTPSSKYHITLFKVPYTLFKVSHYPLQSTTHLFKVSHYPLQSTTTPSSNCIPWLALFQQINEFRNKFLWVLISAKHVVTTCNNTWHFKRCHICTYLNRIIIV